MIDRYVPKPAYVRRLPPRRNMQTYTVPVLDNLAAADAAPSRIETFSIINDE